MQGATERAISYPLLYVPLIFTYYYCSRKVLGFRVWGERENYGGFGAGGGAEVGLELVGAGAGGVHDAEAEDAGDDAAEGGERDEEGLGVPRPPHQPPPRRALLPQDRHPPPLSFPPRRRPDLISQSGSTSDANGVDSGAGGLTCRFIFLLDPN